MLSIADKEKILSYSARFKKENIPQYWEWATFKYELSQLKSPYPVDEYISYPTKLLFAFNKIEGIDVKRVLSEKRIQLEDVRFEIDRFPNDSMSMVQMVKDGYVSNPKYLSYLESSRKIENKRGDFKIILTGLETELLKIISYWEGDGELNS